jgi:hypothetical protein
LRNGDKVIIRGVRGNTNTNGVHFLSAVNSFTNTASIAAGPNGNYLGGGTWERPVDPGYPIITDNDSTVQNNVITVALEKELKFIRSLSLFHIVVPRDIIPLSIYIPDFIPDSTNLENKDYAPYTATDYTTIIPQEAWYMNLRMIGFYSSPLDLWRTYIGGAFSMQNQVTPPPLELWNPPLGLWPTGQPLSYPYQTVPTYVSNLFTIPTEADKFYLILAGYGVYDLVDWTINTGNPASDAFSTDLIRKLLLFLICPVQSYNGRDYVDLILNCHTVTPGNLNFFQAYGFGDFQRYIPGNGVGQTYQPGTNAAYNGANPTGPPNVVVADSPIPFPNFRGNVWGPYNYPGARFQKIGLRDVIQDLYLNGDLNNLHGAPVVISDVPVEGIPTHPQFGLNFGIFVPVTLGNINNATNSNILNAIRIFPNGFGAVNIRANGSGTVYTNIYQQAGGQGPAVDGPPNAWVNNGVYGGAGTFADPIAQGPSGTNPTPYTIDASVSGVAGPSHLSSFTDQGTNNGYFKLSMANYIGHTTNDIPDSDLIIRIEEATRDDFAQSTNSFNGDALFDVPVRLNVGSTSGTQQYIESIQNLLAQANSYWEKRYFNSKASLDKLHLAFYTYGGDPIPLERMLQLRGVSNLLQLLIRIQESITNFSPNLTFLFDPLNPKLIGRVKRYFQIIFKVEIYQGTPPGLEPTSMISNMNQFT